MKKDFAGMMNIYRVEERERARESTRAVMSILESMGSNTHKFGRERAKKARAIISEIYSPPRVSEVARLMPSYGCAPGLALDLTTCDEAGNP